jgi:NADPH:quinone reductase-like Zn-dependent oxidoreductase
MDIAGEVVGLGPGVTSFKVGDKVVALLEILKVFLLPCIRSTYNARSISNLRHHLHLKN